MEEQTVVDVSECGHLNPGFMLAAAKVSFKLMSLHCP